jgi:hypothetical protein
MSERLNSIHAQVQNENPTTDRFGKGYKLRFNWKLSDGLSRLTYLLNV